MTKKEYIFNFYKIFYFCFLVFTFPLSAENTLKLALTSDIAYYPKSEYVSSAKGTHFAPVTGIFSGFEARTTISADYTIPFLYGELPLTKNNHITLSSALELTPITILPQFSIKFSPIAFLEFYGGINFGTGWSLLNFRGMTDYNPSNAEYESIDSFSGIYFYGYWGATFMFDTGAICSGDWNHVVALASYKAGYQSLSGVSSDIWGWKESYGQADGVIFNQYYLLGYQMPVSLSLVAISLELKGHYNSDDYGDYADLYGGDFITVESGPVFQFTLGNTDKLMILPQFATRRSFLQEHDNYKKEPLLNQTGTEWYFERIAARWIHTF